MPRGAGHERVRAPLAAFLGGFFYGFAVLVYYPAALFLPGAAAVLLWKRQYRRLGAAFAGMALPLLLEGLLGLLVWHRWFTPEANGLKGLSQALHDTGAGALLRNCSWGQLSALALFAWPPLAAALLYGAARGARTAPLSGAGVLTFLAGQCVLPQYSSYPYGLA